MCYCLQVPNAPAKLCSSRKAPTARFTTVHSSASDFTFIVDQQRLCTAADAAQSPVSQFGPVAVHATTCDTPVPSKTSAGNRGKLSHSSPEKQRLKRKVKVLCCQSWKPKQRLATLASRRKREEEAALCNMQPDGTWPCCNCHFFCSQMLNSRRKPQGFRWPRDVMLTCLQLHYKSASAYKFLSEKFCVPTSRTLLTFVNTYIRHWTLHLFLFHILSMHCICHRRSLSCTLSCGCFTQLNSRTVTLLRGNLTRKGKMPMVPWVWNTAKSTEGLA